MPKFDHILVDWPYRSSDEVALITLNRPRVRNAITTSVLAEIVTALEILDREEKVRVILITGNPKAFAAGADLKQLAKTDSIGQIKDERFDLWKKFALIHKPIIAVVDGFALGAGLELAMACDMIVASEKAQLGQPEVNLGLMPGAGGTQRLTRAVGKNKAMYLAMTGELFSAFKALEWGLVAKVFPSQVLLDEAFALATTIAAKSPIAVRLIKESINQSQEGHLASGLEFERRNFYLTIASHDSKEGIAAFLEKRQPHYQGN